MQSDSPLDPDTNQLKCNLESDTNPACPCVETDISALLAWRACQCTFMQSPFLISSAKMMSGTIDFFCLIGVVGVGNEET